MKTRNFLCRFTFSLGLCSVLISSGCSSSGPSSATYTEPARVYTTLLEMLRHEPQLNISGSDNNPTIRIRGNRSILGDNEPLFVLDGTPLGTGYNNVRSVDVNNIASIKVLSGSRAAIYGSRGANGVVLLTSK